MDKRHKLRKIQMASKYTRKYSSSQKIKMEYYDLFTKLAEHFLKIETT